MKELKFEELNDGQKAEVMEFFISLLQLGKITLEVKEWAEHHRYVIVDGDVAGWKTATMYSAGEPIKWEPVALDIVSGKPLDLLEDLAPSQTNYLVPRVATAESAKSAEGAMPTGSTIEKVGESPLQVIWADRSLFVPHPQNPRKHFDAVKLAELRANMERHGFTPALSHILARAHPERGDGLQIISGERRWRATEDMPGAFWARQSLFAQSPYLGQKLLPVVVMEMSDNQALEMMHLANLDREDLTALEEAESYRVMLELPTPEGAKNTVELLAERLGRSPRHIHGRLSLISLRGTSVGEAMEAGRLPVSHAREMVKLPAADAAALLPRVLQAETGDGLMPVALLKKVIAAEYMVELRGADFDLEDAGLVPLKVEGAVRICGGACIVPAHDGGADKLFVGVTYCEYNTFADPENESRQGKSAMCRNPKCYELKRAAAHGRWMEGAAKDGVIPLGYEEGARLFETHNGKTLAYNSGFVELSEPPADFDLTDDAPDPAPRWKTLIKERGVPVYLARDKAGEVHQIVNREVAIAAARDNGHDIFRGKRAAKIEPAPEHVPVEPGQPVTTIAKPRESDEEKAARLRAEARKIEAESRVELMMLRGIFAKICADKRPGIPTFELLVGPITELASRMEESSFFQTALAMGYDEKAHGREPAAVGKWLLSHVAAVPPEHCLAVAVLVAAGLTVEDEREAWLKQALKTCGIARKDVEKKVAAEMADEDRRDAEAAEIENGMTWSDNRNKADEFEWSPESEAIHPSYCSLALPESAKCVAVIAVARSHRGWHYGWQLTPRGKHNDTHPCTSISTAHVERKLALTQGILALIEAIDAAQKWAPAVITRLTAYVDKLQSAKADGTTKGAKSAKKKGDK